MKTSHYVLSFDPGAKDTTWAYVVSQVKDNYFEIVESGFAPVLEDLSTLELGPIFDFKNKIETTYRGRIDLVAERFIARGFAAKHAEYIPFTLGVWCSHWLRGNAKLIMASQWKVVMKKLNKHFQPPNKRYDNWWEWHFEQYTTDEAKKKKAIHVQDAATMGYYYFKKQLNIDCKIKGFEFEEKTRTKNGRK